MNTIQAIEHRRAVKSFDPAHPMPEADLRRLLELAKIAPSSFNMQNYRIVVVKDAAQRQAIREVAWGQAQITDASALFVLCADLRAHEKDPARYWAHAPQPVQNVLVPTLTPFYADPRIARDEGMRSSAFAGLTIMLAAIELGYESCPMVGFDAAAVSKLINLPTDHAVSFIVAVGKPLLTEQPHWPRGPRLPDDEVIVTDRFQAS